MGRRTRRRVLTGVGAASALAIGAAVAVTAVMSGEADAEDASRTRTALAVPDGVVRPGEEVRLAGSVATTDGEPLDGARVAIQQRDASGTFRTALRTRVADGRFAAWLHPVGDGEVRAVVAPGSDHETSRSAPATVRVADGDRTSAERVASLGGALGGRTAGGSDGVTAFERGAVVETGTRAWTVRGAIWDAYRDVGGPDSAIGAPTGDALCGPLGGCVQRFERGAAYAEPGAPDPVEIVEGAPDVAAVEAAARTQLGYVEPHWRGSRWNDWVGDDVAWCGIFQSWASQAAGNGTAVPASRTFEDLVARTSSDTARHQPAPVVGSLAFMDLEEAGHPTHVGLVTGVDADGVHLVEGNVGPNDARAVVEMTRTDPPVDYYWLPST